MKEVILKVLQLRPCPLDLNKRRAMSALFGNTVVPLAKILVMSPAKEDEQAELLASAFSKATPDQQAKVVAEVPAFEACFSSAGATEAGKAETKTRAPRGSKVSGEAIGVATEGAEVRLEQIEKMGKLIQEGLAAAHDKLDAQAAKLDQLEVILITLASGLGVELPSGG